MVCPAAFAACDDRGSLAQSIHRGFNGIHLECFVVVHADLRPNSYTGPEQSLAASVVGELWTRRDSRERSEREVGEEMTERTQ